jgi:tetratricopeptide (TPR) repeat protein
MRTRVASALTQIGEYEAAERRYLETLPIMTAELGPEHPDTLSTRNNLGYLYSAWGRFAEAEAIHRALLKSNLAIAPDSQAVAYNYQNLASAVASQGRAEEALELHQQAFERFSAVFNPHHYLTALPLLSSAYLLLELGRPAEAENSAARALDRLETAQPDTYLVGIARCLEGTAQHRQGDLRGLDRVAEARSLMNHIRVPDNYARLCGPQ